MLIQHSPEILVHRLSRLEGRSLDASQALVAKIRGDMLARQAVERLDASKDVPDPHLLDKSA